MDCHTVEMRQADHPLMEGSVESNRFDRLTRTWSTRSPRRTMLGALAGGALGITALTEPEVMAKRKKVTLCFNGQTITVKKSKKADFLGQGATQGSCEGSSSPPPPPPRPSPPPPPVDPCSNGVQDGDETDVDCGGSCGRCSLNQACNGQDDCFTARCNGGVCVVCERESQCGSDDFGSCVCEAGVCVSRAFLFLNGGECSDCPERTVACAPYPDNPPGVFCYANCNDGFVQ